VIATTNRSLRVLVDEGKFRADLYYRLNVVPMTIPPLRERREDVARLIEHFVGKHLDAGTGHAPQFCADLLDRLASLDWPGNVRELENLVRRAVALHPGEQIGAEFLQEIEDPTASAFEPRPAGTQSAHADAVPGTSLREMQRRLLESTLEAS